MDAKTPIDQSTGSQTDGIVIREELKKPENQAKATMPDDLVTRLNHLRSEARQVCEAYLANIDADVATLVDFLNGTSEIQTPDKAKAKTLKSWVKTLDRVALKPPKGRRKDLKRIDDAVRSMMQRAFE